MDPRDSVGRDLLIGLLALQNGLIDQDALISAFRAWTRDKTKAIAEILVAEGKVDAEDRGLLEGLAARHIKRHGGDVERSLAGVAVRSSLRESLAALADTDVEATLSQTTAASPDPASEQTGTFTGEGPGAGRFRVLRPHAKGGLGEVLVALDQELHREVALKRILDHHADDPTSRTRFVLEAEITGGLEHPGIVPVYGLGSSQDGRPYYAMRFIKGDSLKEAIAEFHADHSLKADPGRKAIALRKLLRRFTDVCNAIEYAHTRGVLHRDIKPANVIVGKHGETLVVDWGLAKIVGRADETPTDERTLMPASASGSAETLPGSAMGTPAYMSPEQAEGALDRLGPRTDVYSLGATLYCLLTGKPPFEGEVVLVLRNVKDGRFTKPRAIDPTIDPALEAVCLKAMARDRDDRYASARALAEDIDRWSADEPVTSWREPLPRRLRRWSRRNRTAVGVTAMGVLAALIGTAAVLAVQTRANNDLKKLNNDLTIANARELKANADLTASNAALAAARDRESARFQLAADAIKLFHGQVGDDLVLKEDRFKPLRDKLLKGAAEFYGKLEKLLEGQTDAVSRKRLGDAYFELGFLTDQIGSKPEALATYRKALAVREGLVADDPQNMLLQSDLGGCHHNIAALLSQTGKTAEAMEAFRRALDIRQKLADANPAVTRLQYDLAMCHNGIGMLLSQNGKTAAALESFRRALDIHQKFAKVYPAANQFQSDLAANHFNIGIALSQIGKTVDALEAYHRAVLILKKLADANPTVIEFQSRLAVSHNSIGVRLSKTGKKAEALESYRRALAIQQKLADSNPAATELQSDVAASHHNIGLLLSVSGKPKEALEAYGRALPIQQKIADANPAATELQSRLASSHNGIGFVLSQIGKPAEALEAYGRALHIQQKLADDNPAVTKFQTDLANGHNGIGFLLSQSGKPAEALEAYGRALHIQQILADANPAVTNLQSDLASTQFNIALLLSQTSKPAEALEMYRQAREIFQKLNDTNPGDTQFKLRIASTLYNMGLIQSQTGKPAEALEVFCQALDIRQRLADAFPQTPDLRSAMTEVLWGIGWSRQQLSDHSGAMNDYRRATKILESIPPTSESLYGIACFRSLSAGIAARTGLVGRDEAEALSKAAVSDLRRAIDAGYRDLDHIRKDSDLDPLRGREDFKLLMMDLAMPRDPFKR